MCGAIIINTCYAPCGLSSITYLVIVIACLYFGSKSNITVWFVLVVFNGRSESAHVMRWFRTSDYQLPMIARFMGPTWGPSGADRNHVDPMKIAIWDLKKRWPSFLMCVFVNEPLWVFGIMIIMFSADVTLSNDNDNAIAGYLQDLYRMHTLS